jgi:hypothetical protein
MIVINILNRRKPVIAVTNEKGCLLVISHHRSKDGHVKIQINGKQYRLHRYLFEQKYGKIPEGFVVRHKCDNPNCVNVEHLELGTHEDNVRDRVERDRSAKGERNGRAKLTEDDVRFIRSDNEHSVCQLAKMFNVDHKTIRNIKNYKTWKHVS